MDTQIGIQGAIFEQNPSHSALFSSSWNEVTEEVSTRTLLWTETRVGHGFCCEAVFDEGDFSQSVYSSACKSEFSFL